MTLIRYLPFIHATFPPVGIRHSPSSDRKKSDPGSRGIPAAWTAARPNRQGHACEVRHCKGKIIHPIANILGLEIPLAGPVFYAVLAVHVPVALIAVISGALAALSRKGSPRHIRAGRVYLWSIGLVFMTATILAALRWREDYHLFLIGIAAFAAACVGHLSRNRHGPGHTLHILGMSTSYIFMLIAFYVDNGPQLPVWNRLPHIAYWLLPAVLGGIVTIYALRRARPPA